MKILIIGYGKMGKMVEKIARKRGHTISFRIDNETDWNIMDMDFNFDVAIDFSMPSIVTANINKCFDLNLPVVVGTTGWDNDFEKIKAYCIQNNKSLFYSSNFSIGVFLFNKINSFAAKLLSPYMQYKPEIMEIHHLHKLDKPSGTAKYLAKNMEDYYSDVEIKSVREGEIFGIHQIDYQSEVDVISLRHEAKSREGFALGAVVAAEFLQGKKGFFSMNDLI
ncbi:MAG: 4-hydroxy-tetrahydrodipicolinate reductase [Bacteroidales bacterium]|jgi:4-hydroxy-tetrahydrodipicolinate reductase|nr:4-hydroxy-tetrahydrodipicolinate reductase [Bacteroidales bacterium]